MKRKRPKKEVNPKEGNGLLSGVFTAYFILLLHVLLLGLLGVMVIFFRGMIHYMLWIFLGVLSIIGFSAYRIYTRMREERRNLEELLALPGLNGRSVEVSVLGGLASLRVGNGGGGNNALPPPGVIDLLPSSGQADSPSTQVSRLAELARLYENDMITLDEYERTKDRLLNGASGA